MFLSEISRSINTQCFPKISDEDVRVMKDWIGDYKGKNGILICFAADVLLQIGDVDQALGLYTSVSYSDNYQDVKTAIKQHANFGKSTLTVNNHQQLGGLR